MQQQRRRTPIMVEYRDGDYLMFGKETAVPEALLIGHPERCVRIPMRARAAANLSNSVAVIVFEGTAAEPALKISSSRAFPRV